MKNSCDMLQTIYEGNLGEMLWIEYFLLFYTTYILLNNTIILVWR